MTLDAARNYLSPLTEERLFGWQAALFSTGRGGAKAVKRKPERREGHAGDSRWFYKVIYPCDGYAHGIYVELVLRDDDAEFPRVTIVNAHPELR